MRTKNYFLPLLLAAMMCAPFTANAQVTIGSTELPEAMLDIRAYPEMTERGQGFRLRDGNQASGRVLTAVGNDGMGTWLPSAITVHSSTLTNRTPNATDTRTLPFQDFTSVTAVHFVDSLNFVYLDPGLYMVFMQVPIVFDFAFEPFERVRYSVGVIRAGATTVNFWRVYEIIGPLHANVPIRQMQMGIVDTRSDTGRTRYYVIYRNFMFWNEDGVGATSTRTGNIIVNISGFAHSVFFVPMNQ